MPQGNSMKGRLRALAGALVPTVIRPSLRHAYGRYFKGGRFALNDLDRKLEKWLDYRDGYFVELGANDGFTQSNTYYLELKKSWRGLLVEPAPHNFLSCLRLRGANNRVFCNACVDFDYREKYVDIEYANLMSVSKSLPLDLDYSSTYLHNARAIQDINSQDMSFGAPARTLTSLLDEAQAPTTIDFLSLDVEGAEMAVLGGIDFSRYRFQFLLVECRDLAPLQSFLEGVGYRLEEKLTHHDYLFSSQT
ncbi:MAG: FkbM family methyltransferase [Halieaceae bacterium]|nr:FkbM family methyltransferase [Halieaceae bacterium]